VLVYGVVRGEVRVAYRIFVSHVWRAHHAYYWGLIRLLDQANRFKFEDLSVPKLRPFNGDYADVRGDILKILRDADVVLTINTHVVTNSLAVQDELTEAERLGIPIVAVRPPKRGNTTKTSHFPAVTRAYKATWRSKSIVAAIRKAAKKKAHAVVAASASEKEFEPVGATFSSGPDQLPTEVRGDDEIVPTTPVTGALQSFAGAFRDARPQDVLFNAKDEALIQYPKPPLHKRFGLRK
jgi:hypothetical protein